MTIEDKDAPESPDAAVEAHPAASKKTGLTRIINAAGYSLNGLRSAFQGEAAFRQECLLALLTLPVAFFMLPTGITERMLIVCATFLVLIVELLNSAIEAVVDRVGLEAHPLSGKAKDMGSAAVFVSFLLWGYVWTEVVFSVL